MAWLKPEPGQREAAEPMVEWVNAAPPSELAVELLGAFAAHPPTQKDLNTMLMGVELEHWLFRAYPTHWTTSYPVTQAVMEAMQLLEQSQLVVFWPTGGETSRTRWLVTRLGMATLQQGKDAVRQRITECTGFSAEPGRSQDEPPQ